MNRIVFRIVIICAVAVLASTAAMAEVINVDFGSTDGASGVYVGTAAAPDLGTLWNGVIPAANVTPFASYTSSTLADSLGNATAATVTLSNTWVYDGAADSVIAPALMLDYAFTQASGAAASFTVSIDGLVPGGLYDLYLYSDTGIQRTTFNVGGDVKNVLNTPAQNAWTLGTNYQLYSSIPATGGSIAVTVSGNDFDPITQTGAFYGVLNGLQVVAVPEPSSIAMLAAAAFGLAAFIRRKR
jgi:hypothetical protein